MGKIYHYDAFISYRHKPLDKAVATKLHKLLETYVAPKNLKLGKRKLTRVFRDQEELPTSSDLAHNIQEALQNSAFLIVICSPDTPKSRWVEKEIETFIEMHGTERVLTVLIDGEPQESFPRALSRRKIGDTYVEVEPLAADIRGDTGKERNKKLKKELIRLMAALLGCRYDDLRQRHKERLVKRVTGIGSAIGITLLAFATMSTWQALLLKEQVDKTFSIQSRYLSEDVVERVEEGDRLLATYMGLELLPKHLGKPNRPYVEEAEASLHKALYSYKLDDSLVGRNVLRHESRVKHMTVSSNGEYLLSEEEGAKLTLWEVASGKPLWEKKVGATNSFASGVLLGEREALIREGAVIKKIDALSEQVKWELKFQEESLKIIISEDETTAIIYEGTAMGEAENLYQVDLGKGEIVSKQSIDEGILADLVLSPSKAYVAISMYDEPVQLINLQTKEVRSWELKEGMTTKLAFSSDSKYIACVRNETNPNNPMDDRGSVTIYDLNGKQVLSREVNQWGYDIVRFSSIDPNLVVLVSENYMEIVDVITGEVRNTYVTGGAIESLIWKHEMLVVGCDDGTVRFFLEGNSTEVTDFQVKTKGSVQEVILSNGFLIMLDKDTSLIKVYSQINDEDQRLLGESRFEKSIYGKLSKSGKRGLIYTLDNEVELWDIEGGNTIHNFTLKEGEGSIEQVAFCEEQGIIITNEDIVLKVNPDTREVTNYESGEEVRQITLSRDASKFMVETYSDRTIVDTLTFEPLTSLKDMDTANRSYINNKGEILLLTDEGTKLYKSGKIEELDQEVWTEGVIGEKYMILWDNHKVRIYGGEEVEEIQWPGKVIENIIICPKEEQMILQSNDEKLYIINLQTTEQVGIVQLEPGENGKLLGCEGVLKDESIVLKGEWFTIKISGESYKVIWRSKDVMDVSSEGDAVMVRDERAINRGGFGIYPYYSTEETIVRANQLLEKYWLDNKIVEVHDMD